MEHRSMIRRFRTFFPSGDGSSAPPVTILFSETRHKTVMVSVIRFAELYLVLAAALHFVTILAVGFRAARERRPLRFPPDAPGVTILRPVCGIENHIEATLASAFRLTYPRYEILFCVASAGDPIVAGREPAHRRASKGAGAAARRRRPDQHQSEAEQHRQGMGGGGARLDRDGRQQRADAAGLHRAAPDALGPSHRHRQRTAGRRGAGRASGRSSNAASSTPIRRAGSSRPTPSASASHTARRCSGAVRSWTAQAASGRLPPSRPRTRPARSSSAISDCGRGLCQTPFRSRSETAASSKYGSASFAGRGCGGCRSASISIPRFSQAASCRFASPWFWPRSGRCRLDSRLAFAVLWYGAEALLAATLRWPLSARSIPLWIARDLMLPWLWLAAISGGGFAWRGNEMHVRAPPAPATFSWRRSRAAAAGARRRARTPRRSARRIAGGRRARA